MIIVVGAGCGSLVCLANMHFGLQAGIMNTMSPATALISFAVFKSIGARVDIPFSPADNAIVQAIASSIAGMPYTASLTGVVPALGFLISLEGRDHMRFSPVQLVLWTLGLCLFGIVFAAPFRPYFILREKLRFPGGFATAVLIGLLHGDKATAERVDKDEGSLSSRRVERNATDLLGQSELDSRRADSTRKAPNSTDQKDYITKLIVPFVISAAYVNSSSEAIIDFANILGYPFFARTLSSTCPCIRHCCCA